MSRTNPYQYRVSKENYQAFLEHYAWQLLKTPDYRLGQAFLNYFADIDNIMQNDGDLGRQDSVALYHEIDNERAQTIINGWVDQ